MALINWKDEFEIGIASVDFEHREMISMINNLHASLAATPSREAVASVLGEIFARISAHFALEENEMRAMGFPHYAEHKAAHETLLDEIRDIMDDIEADDAGTYVHDLGERMERWFTMHFSTLDAILHHFLIDSSKT